jgi:hypothetical protein
VHPCRTAAQPVQRRTAAQSVQRRTAAQPVHAPDAEEDGGPSLEARRGLARRDLEEPAKSCLAMEAAMREEGGGGGNDWWARVRGEGTPRWVARWDARATRFRLSSAELT